MRSQKALTIAILMVIVYIIMNNKNTSTSIAIFSSRTFSFVKSRITGYVNMKSNDVVQNLCAYSTNVPTGVKVLSYTIYGRWAKQKVWVDYLKLIAEEANSSSFYKDWQIRLYHDDGFPESFRKLLNQSRVQCCDVTRLPHLGNATNVASMEWRIFPIGDRTVDVMCSRDIDTPLLQREADAVSEWFKSDKAFHCMRDHPQHGEWRVLGGLFCFRNSKNKTLTDQVFSAFMRHHSNKSGSKEPPKASDQKIIRDHLLPLVQHDMMEHDAYSCEHYLHSTPFPSRRVTNTSGFMGCKRPCPRILPPCPIKCRPKNHQDWTFC